MYKKFSVIILAAGHSSRMLSDFPKVMYKIGGKPMLQHLIDTVLKIIGIRSIYIVYANDHFNIMKKMIHVQSSVVTIHWVLQLERLGTGHAVQQALYMINDDDEEILILYGDVPLVSDITLKKLLDIHSQCDIVILTAIFKNPVGYGRIIRNESGSIINIIEDYDIIEDVHKSITEVNTGVLVSFVRNLKFWLRDLNIHHGVKNEFYLTDIVAIAYCQGYTIRSVQPADTFEVMGINNISDLIDLDRKYQKEQAKYLLSIGVIIYDPNRFDLRGTLVCGKDVHIDVNVIIEGHVSLGNKVKIGSNCILRDVSVGDNVVIYPFSVIENATIHDYSQVGPFSRLRGGVELQENSRIGNFVELKNVSFGNTSKAKHLSYLGDAEIGSHVNIGAGAIICNYDGVRKNRTSIKDNVFIGSNSQLIAPITVAKNAIVGAGTTVTKNVAENETVISRVRQFSILNVKRLKK